MPFRVKKYNVIYGIAMTLLIYTIALVSRSFITGDPIRELPYRE